MFELAMRLAVLALLFALAGLATPGRGYFAFLALSVFCIAASLTAAVVDYRRSHEEHSP